ncbi:hypothetical protein FJZ31_43190 [Candidatus Poribacteria bacterium]|nr:hypothetical protein [Candidatus Poribacteria bacterium]
MKNFFLSIWSMALVLIGAIVQISGVVLIHSLGLNYPDVIVYVLSFLGTFCISLIIFELSLIASWIYKKSNNNLIPYLKYQQAVNSRNAAIKRMKNRLIVIEKERNDFKDDRDKHISESVQVQKRADDLQARIADLEKNIDDFKKTSEKVKRELEKEQQRSKTLEARMVELNKLQETNYRKSSEQITKKLEQEKRQVKSLEATIADLEKNIDETGEQMKSELETERKRANILKSKMVELDKKFNELATAYKKVNNQLSSFYKSIPDDIENGNLIFVNDQHWKKAGDGNEKRKWMELFMKLKNPSHRLSKERKINDVFIYPNSRDSDGRRVVYLFEDKQVTIIKVCQVMHHQEYEKLRNEGRLVSNNYLPSRFSYMAL